ncbi:transcriptional regulator with XRE-family HTH domain [Streptomyces sp. PvR006]|uniref:helix-turn-helix domain-containing protein n=1 Tax=Streptomyces sp. PvR006 TaxID=2817860 RepID=UPI0027DD2E00|nr:helix-turn-helix transcriptional regulator [Streptomyces sp. PvR006]MBP2581952.1 transcriptional regulator with XRE-family HTH domain [Streptomyces sp. PvR006]
MPADHPEWITSAQQALGRRIRDARMDANLTQEGLAERAEIDRSTVQRIEGGQSDAKFSHLLQVADALNVPLADLMPRVTARRVQGDAP